jgi:hypothetical protein
MAELSAAFADLVVAVEDAIHGTDRAMIEALVKQTGVDFGRRLVSEARRVQQIQDDLLLWGGESSG